MSTTKTLFNRPDTMFGVCEAIGQDFRINPIIPRIAFALMIFWSPVVAIALYLGLGLAVLVSRLAFPSRAVAVVDADVARDADNDDGAIEHARAA